MVAVGVCLDQVIAALGECVVPILVDDTIVGTGFFVAPRTLVTCSHVLAADPVRAHRIWFQGGFHDVIRLLGREPEPVPGVNHNNLVGLPDAALVEVDVPADHRVALLDWGSPRRGRRLVGFGFPGGEFAVKRNAERVDMEFRTTTTVAGTEWSADTVDGTKVVVEGMSGGPVLDQTTGTVVAVIKGWITEDRARLIPLSYSLDRLAALEQPAEVWPAHDRHHRHGWWPRMSDQVRAEQAAEDSSALTVEAAVTGPERADLLAVLADLAVPAGLPSRLIRLLRPGLPPEDAAPVRYARDGVMALLRSPSNNAAPADIVRYLGLLCAGDEVPETGECETWTSGFAKKHGLEFEPLEPPAPEPRVVRPGAHIVVQPCDRIGREFQVTLWSVEPSGTMRQAEGESDKLVKSQICDFVAPRLKAILAGLRREHGIGADEPLLIDLVIPESLRDLDPGSWPLYRGGRTLGDRHIVVLRDYRRYHDEDEERVTQEEWWAAIRQMAAVPVRQVSCADLLSPQSQSADERAAVLLPSPTAFRQRGYTALEELIFRGGAVALWYQEPCPRHGGDGADQPATTSCEGDDYTSALAPLLSGVTLADFPLLLWQRLRSFADATGSALSRPGVLWDDPTRRPDFWPLSPTRSGP